MHKVVLHNIPLSLDIAFHDSVFHPCSMSTNELMGLTDLETEMGHNAITILRASMTFPSPLVQLFVFPYAHEVCDQINFLSAF